ncbi:Transcriptional regulator, LacI family [Acidisarcina polymorpha]|uniref:Transcriptional regulator, LacI family n=1 Tax=Acidisarcina polymorpha TaxID=2211140 RepID=A0A2Z5FZ50_9BACT|nr:Transcriptional regulator, LacI family [Acidisarcina polymorpha]
MTTTQNRNAPTLVDVAREAGVSLKTASRVLNGAASVKEDKTSKVREAMTRLGYRPNELARGLKARKSAAIGMIVANLSDPFTASAVKAVQEVSRANGHVVILASSGGYPDVERSEIESLVGRQIDGLIIAPADGRTDNFSDVIPPELKVVTFDQPVKHSRFDVVTIPNRRSAKEATQHLLGHGFQRIVAIGARPHLYTCSERLAGYRDAISVASLEPRMCTVEHETALTSEWLSDSVFKKHKADAIIPMNWVCTMLTLRGLRVLGKEPGRDVPILSFDDFDLADMLSPTISAVRQPAAQFGYEAARLLFNRLNGQASEKRASVVLSTELILRESCGCSLSGRRPRATRPRR